MEESIQKIFEQHQEGMNRQLLEHQRSMDEQFRSFTSLLHKLQSSNVSTKTAVGSSPMHTEGRHPFSFNPRIELPLFMGGNQKVTLASIHLEGRAKIWFEGYGRARPIVDWEDFIVDLYARFKDDKHVCSRFSNDADHKSLLNHPASTSSPLITQEPFGRWSDVHVDGLETYQGHTSMVKSFSVNNVSLFESSADNPVQKDSSYLKLEFQVSRKTTLIPVDCSHLVEHLSSESCDDSDVAKRDKREIVKANASEEHKSMAKLESVARTNSAESSQYSNSKVQFPPQGNPRSISFAIGGEIMANGLDYYCGNPFEWGHKCERKGIQPFLVELLGKKMVDQFEIPGWAARAGSATSISIHTLPENSGCQIMRMTGFVGKRALQFLIDLGGTHSFGVNMMLIKLGFYPKFSRALRITVTTGYNIQGTSVCKNIIGVLQNGSKEALPVLFKLLNEYVRVQVLQTPAGLPPNRSTFGPGISLKEGSHLVTLIPYKHSQSDEAHSQEICKVSVNCSRPIQILDQIRIRRRNTTRR
ncbi:unnamed protein product [Cuscuta campestris]|uniref:Retrotransposon gag domain-containing protein n=1 Tax=Cuscuta campestris TaxID=132261 RepID=A0A484MD51_9ASTE|nr:unnamed protein product [Cuscuta campestris]